MMAASKQRIPYFIEPLFTFKKPNYNQILLPVTHS